MRALERRSLLAAAGVVMPGREAARADIIDVQKGLSLFYGVRRA